MTPEEGLSAAAVKGIDFGVDELGSAEIITIEQINVDDDYQRDLRHAFVNQLAQGYDIVKAGAILVNERGDGVLWCVDGQHRMAAALQAGETEIFAHVLHGKTKEQEAEIRLARNNRKSDTMQEKFRTRLVMGEEKAHRMVEIVEQHGTKINLMPVNYVGINAIATLELLYDIDGNGVWLGRVLRLIQEAYGEEVSDATGETYSGMTPQTCSSSMMKAVCWFLAQHVDHREVTYADFVERLGAAGVDDIRRKAVSHKAANGGAMWLNYYRSLVEIWNFRRSDSKKIKWKTIGSITRLGAAGVRKDDWEAVRDRVAITS